MANSLSPSFLSVAALLFLVLSSATASSGVHDLLKKYGLPKGLLPHSAKDYTLNDDGTFEVRLKKPCYVQFTDLVYYDKTIRGKISYGLITNIEGIQVKKVFVWFPISRIQVDEDEETIEFKVGFLSESFPTKTFKDVPDCKDNKDSYRGAAGLIPVELLPVAEV
ncbi:hypothetical protein Cni_G12945 [Canna indica]|uniref:Uncharacterized protein n=1 Tax=Canna indica TaxID=4628 RepID=A0AAQ3K934_9LILI|nr:hypothetical protein Cni_G12945 [Canna indica]